MTTFAPILYWFPGVLEMPLEYEPRFRTSGRLVITYATQSHGPESGRGGYMASPFERVLLQYAPERQRWDQVGPGVWIGADRDAGPAEFAKPRQLPGVEVEMGDGRRWLIPVANPFATACTLPQWDVLRPDGSWGRQIQDRFLALSRRAADFAALMRARVLEQRQIDVEVDEADARALVADALACNYDVTLAELSALRVFSPDACAAALRALVDWEEIARVILETLGAGEGAAGVPFAAGATPAGSSTLHGEPA